LCHKGSSMHIWLSIVNGLLSIMIFKINERRIAKGLAFGFD
jgi:hypothetical protein